MVGFRKEKNIRYSKRCQLYFIIVFAAIIRVNTVNRIRKLKKIHGTTLLFIHCTKIHFIFPVRTDNGLKCHSGRIQGSHSRGNGVYTDSDTTYD